MLRLAAVADAFASMGVRDPTGRSGRDAGQQLDLRVRAWLRPGLVRAEFGVTHLVDGRFLRLAPKAADVAAARCTGSNARGYGNRVASAFVPAAKTTPLASE